MYCEIKLMALPKNNFLKKGWHRQAYSKYILIYLNLSVEIHLLQNICVHVPVFNIFTIQYIYYTVFLNNNPFFNAYFSKMKKKYTRSSAGAVSFKSINHWTYLIIYFIFCTLILHIFYNWKLIMNYTGCIIYLYSVVFSNLSNSVYP